MRNYFNFSELRCTDTGIPNHVDDLDVFENLKKLRLALNIIRSLVGAPIIVHSAYRCKEVNDAVGGSKASYHLFGRAADISCSRSAVLKSILVEWKKAGILSELVIHDTYFHIAL